SLELAPGEKVKAYGLDGTTLLRVDITGRGPTRMEAMPPIGTSLGIAPDQVQQLDGVVTRVDRHGAAIPGKKSVQTARVGQRRRSAEPADARERHLARRRAAGAEPIRPAARASGRRRGCGPGRAG